MPQELQKRQKQCEMRLRKPQRIARPRRLRRRHIGDQRIEVETGRQKGVPLTLGLILRIEITQLLGVLLGKGQEIFERALINRRVPRLQGRLQAGRLAGAVAMPMVLES